MFFSAVYPCIDKDIWRELCNCKSFSNKAFLDGFDYMPLSPSDCLLTFLLSELAHGIRIL